MIHINDRLITEVAFRNNHISGIRITNNMRQRGLILHLNTAMLRKLSGNFSCDSDFFANSKLLHHRAITNYDQFERFCILAIEHY